MHDWQRVKDIFASVLDQPSENRDEFLRHQCDGDEQLIGELQSLIAAHDEPDNLIEKNSIDLAATISSNNSSLSGKRFGNYSIIREIGSGGMGAVFLAERNDGELQMQVALKIVRQSVADREILARFRRERQILADLHHRNIAVLHDGGVSEKGEPYLAMEFIDGDTLIDHADKNEMSIVSRLTLFLKVCSAVTYAHQNLIVHRDLKPSNILVGIDGEPKLLDFGLAKSFETENQDNQTTLRAFTPAYASPEQIVGRNITTASDIYSLGVIFYELLTGTKPLDFDNKSYEEIVQTINASEPIPPSQTPDASGIENAKGRLKGDLDNIALMALRKEPERRYRSVEEMAEDVRNHLSGRPVTARQNTFGYRTGKFVTRNKVAVAAAAIVLISLIAGLAFSLWQANIARRETERSNAVNQFLHQILLTASPGGMPGGRQNEVATIIDVLNDVEKKLDADLSSEPEVRADLRRLIGDIYLAQGRYEEAERNLTKGFNEHLAIYGSDNVRTLQSEISLAALFFTKADYEKTIEIYNRRSEAFTAEYRAGRIPPDFYLPRLSTFALVFRARGDAIKAESMLREVIDEAKKTDSYKVAIDATDFLTLILLDQGRFAEARTAQTQAVDRLRETTGNDSPMVGSAMTLLGSIQMEEGDLDLAGMNLSQAEVIYRKNFGPDYMPLYDNIRLQAQVAYAKRDFTHARELIDITLANYRKNSSPKYISFATALTIEGLILNKLNSPDQSVEVLYEALKLRNENLPAGHFMTAITKGALGECLTGRKNFVEAEPLLIESFETLLSSQGPRNPRTNLAKTRLTTLYQAWNKPDLAARYLQR